MRTRYLHGIITGVKSDGVFNTGPKPFYSHVFTIEPKLARLRFTRSTRPFYQKTPLKIIEDILKGHQLLSSERLPSTYLTQFDDGSYMLFDQRGVSDLNFLQHILSLYGLSFTFQHKRLSGSLVDAELFFSEGRTFPVSDIVYSDGRLIPAVMQFMYHAADEDQSLWKMDKWSMNEMIGVDGMELTAPYPDANYGSIGWYRGNSGAGRRSITYPSMFHRYQRDTDNKKINQDVSCILDASYRTLHLAKSSWTGAAANLALQPGSIFQLRGFYGTGNTTSLSAMVTALHLHCRARKPDGMVSSQDRDGGELTEAQIRCADYRDETGCNNKGWRFCADPR